MGANTINRLNLADAKSVIAALNAIDTKTASLTEAERSAYGNDMVIKIRIKLREVLEKLDRNFGDS